MCGVLAVCLARPPCPLCRPWKGYDTPIAGNQQLLCWPIWPRGMRAWGPAGQTLHFLSISPFCCFVVQETPRGNTKHFPRSAGLLAFYFLCGRMYARSGNGCPWWGWWPGREPGKTIPQPPFPGCPPLTHPSGHPMPRVAGCLRIVPIPAEWRGNGA